MFFKRKKEQKKFEEEFFRIQDLKTKVINLELEIEKLKTHLASLRNSFNRAVGYGEIKPETSKSVDGLDRLRK